MTIGEKSWHFAYARISAHRYMSRLEAAMRLYYEWNLIAEQRAQCTFRVENLSKTFPRMMGACGCPASGLMPSKDAGRNIRTHEDVTVNQMRAVDRELSDKIAQMADRYGYGG